MRRDRSLFQSGILAAVLAATLQFVLLAGSLSGVFSPAGAVEQITDSRHCQDVPGGHRHNDAACALCPICLSLTLPGVLPQPAPAVPARRAPVVIVGQARLAAQLHPCRVLAAAFPRGPPLI